jgi:2-polyprenyl-6-methoxyphenol hydroxylase-like FAD-dependent oxidoreductase
MDISILGAGIAGIATAIALKEAGYECSIYERHDRCTDIGAGIVLWPNASFVLHSLGLLDVIKESSGLVSSMNRLSSSGESLGELDVEQLNREMGYESYSILRKDLLSILTSRAHELNIPLLYNHSITSLSDNEDTVTVKFDNGKEISPDVIIGADGRMNSPCRAYVHGENSPKFQGFINWIGVWENCEEPLSKDLLSKISVSDYWGVGTRFGIVPIDDKKLYWAGGVCADTVGTKDPSLYKEELFQLFKDWPDPIPRLIEESELRRINKVYVHDHDPIDLWHKKSVLLIGDAAHAPLPTSGQGACQALEDAWHLGNCFKRGSDITEIFEAFTALRKSKTRGTTMGARSLAQFIFSEDEQHCRERDETSKNNDYRAMITGMAQGWSAGLPL